jgi:hypothetical protein
MSSKMFLQAALETWVLQKMNEKHSLYQILNTETHKQSMNITKAPQMPHKHSEPHNTVNVTDTQQWSSHNHPDSIYTF